MSVKVEKINKSVHGKKILNDISFEISDEFLVILGKSGSGKSTLLRIIMGLSQQDSGTISINDRAIEDELARDRSISMIFQNYALYPHMSVENNILFPGKKDKLIKVREVAEKLGINKLLNYYPAQLSGGEQQRVAISRALLEDKDIYLLDEPFANLDQENRSIMRAEVQSLQKELKKPFIMVTHDLTDALTLADKIMILINGEIVQFGSFEEVYKNPKTLEALALLTSGELNVVSAKRFNEELIIDLDKKIMLAWKEFNKISNKDTGDYKLAFRPEALELDDGTKKGLRINKKIESFEFYGSKVKINFDFTKTRFTMIANSNINIRKNDNVNLIVAYENLYIYEDN